VAACGVHVGEKVCTVGGSMRGRLASAAAAEWEKGVFFKYDRTMC
jgi:hypothetical protein